MPTGREVNSQYNCQYCPLISTPGYFCCCNALRSKAVYLNKRITNEM